MLITHDGPLWRPYGCALWQKPGTDGKNMGTVTRPCLFFAAEKKNVLAPDGINTSLVESLVQIKFKKQIRYQRLIKRTGKKCGENNWWKTKYVYWKRSMFILCFPYGKENHAWKNREVSIYYSMTRLLTGFLGALPTCDSCGKSMCEQVCVIVFGDVQQ